MSELLTRARELDERDPLGDLRNEFWIPQDQQGQPKRYLCGNSLGLQPRALQREMNGELARWANYGVDGHFEGDYPWMPYHEFVREPLARLVGALPHEVVAMNSLTVNLHLMMASFYRPTTTRYRIVIEKQAFPSDRYAVASQLRWHGYDETDGLVELEDEPGSATCSVDTLRDYLAREGDSVALVLMPGVQYLSGQLQDMAGVCEVARAAGAAVGLDLAHAAGNVPLSLHDWGPDFAVWCSYKYLNSGAGAVAGCFVHERHAERADLPRLAGWWGHEASTRFEMGPQFVPSFGADGWQLSNPPILALAPLRVSLNIFDAVGMSALRAKSVELTGFLAQAIVNEAGAHIDIMTPDEPERRGCQLSLRLHQGRERGRAVFDALQARGIVCDWREPDVIRVAPAPLYNSFEDAAVFAETLRELHA